MRRPPPATVLAVLGTLGLLLAACGSGTGDVAARADGGPRVVVTTTILADVVADVVGEAGTVEALMGPGQDPHGFAPSARQTRTIREADLVVANGLGLEAGLQDALEGAEADGVPVLHLAEELDPLAFGGDGHEADEHTDEGHGHEAEDPHVWLDPVRMAEGARVVAGRLAEVDEARDEAAWTGRGEEVAAAIEGVHDDVRAILDRVPAACRQLVTNHDSLGYLAARYRLEVVGTVVPGTSTQVDTSARAFAELADLLRGSDVPAVFAETTQSTQLAESLAAEVGRDVEVVELYTGSLGEPGSGATTYGDLLRTDARRIADALADC